MRAFLLSAAVLLAACSGGDEANTAAETPAPKATGPAPQTPVTGISPEPGNSSSWMRTRDDAGDPKSAPYGNLLDQPVVNGAGR